MLSQQQSSSYLPQYNPFLDEDKNASVATSNQDASLLFNTEADHHQLTPAELDSAFAEEDTSFIPLSPSMPCSNYLYGLDGSEGISQLFDIDDSHLTPSDT